jgi:hypothetical protein
VEAPKPEPTFAEFVNAEPEPTPTPQLVATPEQPKPTWKMEIYEGSDKKTYAMELPLPAGEPKAAATAAAGGNWTSPLLNWLGGQKTPRQTATTLQP